MSRRTLDLPFTVNCILKHYKGKGLIFSPNLHKGLISTCEKGAKLVSGKLPRASL